MVEVVLRSNTFTLWNSTAGAVEYALTALPTLRDEDLCLVVIAVGRCRLQSQVTTEEGV